MVSRGATIIIWSSIINQHLHLIFSSLFKRQINAAAKNRKKFVGFLSQHYSPLKYCNGTNHDGEQEPALHVRNSSDEKCGSWNEGTLSGQSSESGIEEELHESGQYQTQEDGSPHSTKFQKGEGNRKHE